MTAPIFQPVCTCYTVWHTVTPPPQCPRHSPQFWQVGQQIVQIGTPQTVTMTTPWMVGFETPRSRTKPKSRKR